MRDVFLTSSPRTEGGHQDSISWYVSCEIRECEENDDSPQGYYGALNLDGGGWLQQRLGYSVLSTLYVRCSNG